MDRRLIRSWAGRPGRERHLLSFTSLLCALFCVLGGFSLGFRWTSQGLLLDILGLLCYVVFPDWIQTGYTLFSFATLEEAPASVLGRRWFPPRQFVTSAFGVKPPKRVIRYSSMAHFKAAPHLIARTVLHLCRFRFSMRMV